MLDVLCRASAACTPCHFMPHVPVQCRGGAWLACCMLQAATHTCCRCSRAYGHLARVCCACAGSRRRRFHDRWHTGARRQHDRQHREHYGARLARLWARRVAVEVAAVKRAAAENRVRIGAGRRRRAEIRASLAVARGVVLSKRSRCCFAGCRTGAYRRHPPSCKFSPRCQGVQRVRAFFAHACLPMRAIGYAGSVA